MTNILIDIDAENKCGYYFKYSEHDKYAQVRINTRKSNN